MKNRKNKYLVESARIADAYLRMYEPKRVNEDTFADKAKELEEFGKWADAQPSAKIKTNQQSAVQTMKPQTKQLPKSTVSPDSSQFLSGISKVSGKMLGGVGNAFKVDKAKELEEFGKWVDAQPAAKIKTTQQEEIEYPENGDVEYTGEEEDYLTGKTDVRPKTLAPNARDEYRKSVGESYDNTEYKYYVVIKNNGKPVIESGYEFVEDAKDRAKEIRSELGRQAKVYTKNGLKTKFSIDSSDDGVWVRGDISKINENSRYGRLRVDPVEVFTIEISRVDDNGDYESVDDMKYATTFYDIDTAIDAAKRAYNEYAVDGDNIVVDVCGGEEEHENGDIYGEPVVVYTVDSNTVDEVGDIDTNESYEDNGEVDYGSDGDSKYAEDYEDDRLKNAIAVVKRICSKFGAKVTGVAEGPYSDSVSVFIKIKDDNKTPGVGFDMNRIMGVGYGIQRSLDKAGIIGTVGAGGYTGNTTKIILSKKNPIVESSMSDEDAVKVLANASLNDVEAADLGLISHEKADPYNVLDDDEDDGDDEEDEVSNEDIHAEYLQFLGGREPCVETRDGVIYFQYDPSRNVFAYGSATNTGLLEDGSMEYDKSESMLTNLENLHDEIYAKFGYPEDMD